MKRWMSFPVSSRFPDYEKTGRGKIPFGNDVRGERFPRDSILTEGVLGECVPMTEEWGDEALFVTLDKKRKWLAEI